MNLSGVFAEAFVDPNYILSVDILINIVIFAHESFFKPTTIVFVLPSFEDFKLLFGGRFTVLEI